MLHRKEYAKKTPARRGTPDVPHLTKEAGFTYFIYAGFEIVRRDKSQISA